ncbi:MAG: hypothetical protein A3A98_01245 [Candidatus Staskawiczbacteria bacterium RIFCSPLOWO2_01_FULL_40_39]|uniref:Type II secretion system protein GspF domain-containing protein n=1 Tax=Candidatus Staskawiczbacteria bacterium RIFCSPHIGHO2_01_FULL_39_25 TaxID=1802202 RepID=A0A1G2HN88_9BACT|nr:MAG: hypothetical protein A2730_01245 [Candidatus Staskawiczbacteria bacterium RIFCSPHIGHO2_01_FULL_39_25]OGZ73353.1 MAG: hypothetical protein A3A98_01245 [Candidatus Staskawiczbacteria bacterium RIFCSPLOWO2_01_FULL_40_39]OGZ76880.1 MAG: hypothetical protein A3I87_00505 [Candidatus Staskawiczbacteria bacterium RIFCSPLOWO2_02_FULL_39_8]
MPNYFYTAKSFEGESQKGVLDAKDERELAQSLKNQGLILIQCATQESKEKRTLSIALPFPRISLIEKILMIRNLGVMFSTGLPLVKSFDILSAQTKNKYLKKALTNIKDQINKGENLSDALSKFPDIFSELFVNMIKVGEESGTLDEIFQILSLQLTKEHDLRSKIKNAMIYPSIIVMVMIVVGIIIVTVVLPSLTVFFTSLNVNLPIYTKILLFVGGFLLKQWYLLIVLPISLALIFWLIIRTRQGKWMIDTFLLKAPLISPIIKKSNSAFLIRSLSSLITAGVPLIRSLEISSKIVGNHYFREAIMDAEKKIRKGEKLSSALKPYQNLFPFGVVEMVEVGEETGKTSAILKKLADFYEQEAVNAIEKLSILIEPILIIILGLAVGIFALSIIQPMYSSLKSVNQ